jgi:hypothetical protein
MSEFLTLAMLRSLGIVIVVVIIAQLISIPVGDALKARGLPR